jgi:predicted RND superfamily exporter protein
VRHSKSGRKTFYDRFGWLILIACFCCIPFAFIGAGNAVQSNVNKVEDWLPKGYAETNELSWFRKNFPSDQFVLISWDGCQLSDAADGNPAGDDPRIAKLVDLVAPSVANPTDQDAVEAKKYFKGATSARSLIGQLTTGQHPLSYTEAIERLKGSVIGPDGRQTCVIVSLDPATTAKLKPILGHGQMRIFRPNVPPGVLRRLIAKAGIEDAELHMGGPPVDNISIDEEGEKTLIRLAGFSGLLGLVLAWWSLRSIVLTWIVFSCAVTSAAASLAMIWATGETVDAIVLSMPSLVYVLAISGAVHFINYYKDAVREGGLHGATERAVIHALKPAILCSLTTAIGLISLCASELVPIRKFGLYSATGVMILNVILFLILPAALHVIRYAKRWENEKPVEAAKTPSNTTTKGERFWATVASFIVRNHFGVSLGTVFLVGFIGFGLGKTKTSIDLLELFDSQAKILQDYRWLEEKLGMLVPLEIVVEFDTGSIAKTEVKTGDATSADATKTEEALNDDLTRLSFLERMETVVRIQDVIKQKFGEEGTKIVGRSMSAATFASSLPSSGTSTQTYLTRRTYNKTLESNREEFMKSGFLRIDDQTGSELWRISLRVAAFQGVDYGQFVTELKDSLFPIIQAQHDRVRILRQVAAWSGEAKMVGKEIVLWDPMIRGLSEEEATKSKLRSDELVSLLAKSRVKVSRLEASPSSIPLVQMQKLNDVDAVVMTGSFSNGEVGTLGVTLDRVIDLQSDDSKTPKQWVNSVYTGVVPIVYKAQRALLTSLVESTLWSFLTITPLMIFVTRSFRAGLVAMIPNVVPVIVIFGAMGWLGIPIDIGSMMTASIALGVAVDDTIHFLSWFRGDVHHYRNRNKAIISCYAKCATPTLQAACISGLGLSVFALSTFTPTQRFGWLMLTILIAGVVAELILLPAILAGPLGKVFEPRQVRHTAIGRMMLIFRYQFRKRFERTTQTDKKDKSGSKLQSAA